MTGRLRQTRQTRHARRGSERVIDDRMGNVREVAIEDEMRSAYIDYAMSSSSRAPSPTCATA